MTINHPHSLFRSGTVRHVKRPVKSSKRARGAWDHHAASGPIVWMQLLDGYWGAMRPNGDIDEIENLYWLEKKPEELSE